MGFDETLIRQLESYGRVFTAGTSETALQIAFRRDKEVDFLLKHLERARQKSACSIGPSGCGKSVILRQMIQQLVNRRNQPWLFLETSTSLLMKDTKYLGEWQTRFHKLMDLVTGTPRIAIYFTDVPNLTGAGRHSDSEENVASCTGPTHGVRGLYRIGRTDRRAIDGLAGSVPLVSQSVQPDPRRSASCR